MKGECTNLLGVNNQDSAGDAARSMGCMGLQVPSFAKFKYVLFGEKRRIFGPKDGPR